MFRFGNMTSTIRDHLFRKVNMKRTPSRTFTASDDANAAFFCDDPSCFFSGGDCLWPDELLANATDAATRRGITSGLRILKQMARAGARSSPYSRPRIDERQLINTWTIGQ